MNWIPLASGKRPTYGDPVFLYNEKADLYSHGYLEEVTENSTGRTCTFVTGYNANGELEKDNSFTHFAIPKPPSK